MATQTKDECLEQLKKALKDAFVRPRGEKVDIFLPRGKAREIFRFHEDLVKTLYAESDLSKTENASQADAFFDAVIGNNDDDALSNFLATLIYGPFRPQSCQRFASLCNQPPAHRKWADKDLPLMKHQVCEFLGEDNIDFDNFSIDQDIFSPRMLSKGDLIDLDVDSRPPGIHYINESPIGGGAHGIVYEVTLAGNHFGKGSNGSTTCARKDIDTTRLNTFNAEWERAKILDCNEKRNHNIMEVFAAIRTPTSLTLFCELATCDLADFVTETPQPEPWDFAHRLLQFCGILKAVKFLHKEVKSDLGSHKSCFHLDLKPTNILIFNQEPADEIFKICDFSVSSFKEKTDSMPTSKRRGSTRDIETPAKIGDFCACLAPEAFGPEGSVSARTDIWHLGCVLCIYIAWLYGGPEGVMTLERERYMTDKKTDWFFDAVEQIECPSEMETNYYRKDSDGKKYHIFWLNPNVENWLDKLEDTKKGQEVVKLVRLIKTKLLVVDPKKRAKIEDVYDELKSIAESLHVD